MLNSYLLNFHYLIQSIQPEVSPTIGQPTFSTHTVSSHSFAESSTAASSTNSDFEAHSTLSQSSFNQGYYERFFIEERKLGRGFRGSVYLCKVNHKYKMCFFF